MNEGFLLDALMRLIPLVLSLSVHEWAHAWSAHRLGDDTAQRQGRLTLNPISHIDPIGTILMPLLSPIPFGWARPVPFNAVNFTRKIRMRVGVMIVAAAGPLSNLVLAILCVMLEGLCRRFDIGGDGLLVLLGYGLQLNVALAVFNMLPIRPLDGGQVAEGLMPERLRPSWERIAVYGPLVLIGVFVVDFYYGLGILSWPVAHAVALGRIMMLSIAGI
jgi:Zn-dependent protease